ncbi:selenide, water dikinase [Tissierella creatinophila DSM 6911]|uniref:Selenide, water dikinase n=1 Tax=Tissierella creatinophila DSM 6911 TaxID=1123403 RepID=A0A1U7M7T7_TISCR|nr:selenide, water dikinase [Tissierella creatinophila DSM 6911]
MSQVLRHLPKIQDENLIVGLDTADDAAVYKINEDLAIIQTLDFFTPVVDDPYTFGQIAAANSLSDIYAMGGEPKLCMNIVCFPDCLNPEILTEILKGGFDKVKESGALLVGGHSVSDDEPKYGLSITGFVNPKKVLTNSNAKVGDVLIITKPLGLGIINTAIKGEIADAETYKIAVEVMTTLNKFGKEAIEGIVGVNSVTDITGFGLLGHALEMAEGSDVTININYKSIPLIKNSLEYARMGLVPAGTYANKTHIGDKVLFEENVPEDIKDVLYDPQTSGGLMISVSKEDSKQVLERLKSSRLPYGIIGEVQKYEKNFINVK